MSKSGHVQVNNVDYILSFTRYGGGLPGNPLRCTYEGTLRDLMMYSQKSPKKLYYQLVRKRSLTTVPNCSLLEVQ